MKNFDTKEMQEYYENKADRKIEDSLQVECEAYLVSKDIKYFHKYNNAKQNKYRSSAHKRYKGWPDLTIMPGNSMCVFIELKVGENVLSKEQLQFREWALDSGYDFHTVFDIETFKEIIDWM